MDERLFRILEFNIIRDKLAALTSSEISRRTAENLVPQTDPETVRETLKETDDAVALIMKRGRPPLGGIVDVTPSVKRACGGSMLAFTELLAIAGVLKVARRTVNYCGEEKSAEDGGENSVVDKIVRLTEDYRLETYIYRCIIVSSNRNYMSVQTLHHSAKL